MQITSTSSHRAASLRPTERKPDLLAFTVALSDGDEDAIRHMLINRPQLVRDTDRHGNTALHLAVEAHCSPSLLGVLLRTGADPGYANARGDTPLHLLATQDGADRELISTLLAAGGLALADRLDRSRRTALQRARETGSPAVVDRLVSDINVLERCAAWRQDNVRSVWIALVDGLEQDEPLTSLMGLVLMLGGVNAADNRGVTVLMRAADAGRLDVVASLLELGANVNATFHCQRTGLTHSALMFALPYPAVTRLLVAWGADPMQAYSLAPDPFDRPRTVLDIAAEGGAIDSMVALLSAYPREDWDNRDLGSALLTALRAGQPHLAFTLLEFSSALDAETMRLARPLAIATGNHELIHLLLALDAQGAPATAAPARARVRNVASAGPAAEPVRPRVTPAPEPVQSRPAPALPPPAAASTAPTAAQPTPNSPKRRSSECTLL